MKLTGITLFATFLGVASGKINVRASPLRGNNDVGNDGKAAAAVAATRALQSENEVPTEEEVRSWFGLWDEALATGDSAVVADMYGEGATLLPTMSDELRTDVAGITDYFDKFLVNGPRGRIVEGHVEAGADWATDIGSYEFTFAATGDVVLGRPISSFL